MLPTGQRVIQKPATTEIVAQFVELALGRVHNEHHQRR